MCPAALLFICGIFRAPARGCLRRPHFFQQRKKWGENAAKSPSRLDFLSPLATAKKPQKIEIILAKRK
jgi:hypothetical protein